MNFLVRVKNPLFWAQIAMAILTPILAYFGLSGADITTWPMLGDTLLQAVCNPYVCVLVIVSVFNALTDPTTKGVTDSEKAKTYVTPA